MAKDAILEPFLDEDAHRSSIIDGRLDFAKPGIRAVAIPATNLPGPSFRPAVVHALGNDVVAAAHEPTEVIIAASTTVNAPNRAPTLFWS